MPPNSWMFNVLDPLDADIVINGPWKKLGHFDIFAFHCRWDAEIVETIVPGAK